jgi:hypothetical protein
MDYLHFSPVPITLVSNYAESETDDTVITRYDIEHHYQTPIIFEDLGNGLLDVITESGEVVFTLINTKIGYQDVNLTYRFTDDTNLNNKLNKILFEIFIIHYLYAHVIDGHIENVRGELNLMRFYESITIGVLEDFREELSTYLNLDISKLNVFDEMDLNVYIANWTFSIPRVDALLHIVGWIPDTNIALYLLST